MCKKLIFLISFVLVLSIGGAANAALEDGLVVRLDFETDYSDSSVNGYDGTPGSGVSVSGGTASFDGTENAYVDIELGADNPCNGTSDYTIAVAYSCTNTNEGPENQNDMLIGMSTAGESENALGFVTSGDEGALLDIWGINYCNPAGPHAFTYADGSLHIIVMTYDDDGEQEACQWYHLAYDGTVTPLDLSLIHI